MNTAKLAPYQKKGIKFLSDLSSPNKLLADEMGLGKTVQAIMACKETGAKRILVICPAAVKSNWLREFRKWIPDSYPNASIAFGIGFKVPKDTELLIVNYELLTYKRKDSRPFLAHIKEWMRENPVDVLIVDEAHYLKNPKAARTRVILGKNYSLGQLATRRFLLTGTPVLNKPYELYVILRVLFPQVIKDYADNHSFGVRYCGAYCVDGIWNYDGASHISELAEKLQPYMLRRTKAQVYTELPAMRETAIPIEVSLSHKEQLAIDEAPVSTARRLLAMKKLPVVAQYIEDALPSIGKAVLFAHHVDVIASLAEQLEAHYPVVYRGGMSHQAKEKALDDFINGDSKVFIGQIHACGTGVDGLQRACANVFFVEIDWSPGVMEQAKGRLHRIGQAHGMVNAYTFFIPGTLEESMVQVVDRKANVIKKLIQETDEPFTTEEKETSMSIESLLERIAGAVEKNNQLLGDLTTLGNIASIDLTPASIEAEVEEPTHEKTPKEEAPKAKKTKAKASTEVTATLNAFTTSLKGLALVEEPEVEEIASIPEDEVTHEDIRAVVKEFINSADDKNSGTSRKEDVRAIIRKYAVSINDISRDQLGAAYLGLMTFITEYQDAAVVENDEL